jgi:hypothetical protein
VIAWEGIKFDWLDLGGLLKYSAKELKDLMKLHGDC